MDEDLGMDFGPNEENIDKTVGECESVISDGGIETKKEKTRRKMIADNKAILSLMEQPNEDGKCWLEQPEACIFTCFLCTSVVETFTKICDHMENAHPLDLGMFPGAMADSPTAGNQCIACPKRFKKKSHLKVIFCCYNKHRLHVIS